jgi:microcystin-dependent protein
VSASFASQSISASYAPFNQSFQASASWASQSLSASYAVSASYAPFQGDTTPIGAIMGFATTTAPNNWLECDGAAYLTQSFSALYAAISSSNASASFGFLCDSFGNRDAAGYYFKVPDLRGEFVRGWDHNRGLDTNRIFASIQTASLGQHYHGVGSFTSTGNDDIGIIQRTWDDGQTYTARIAYGEANVYGTFAVNNPTAGAALGTTSPLNATTAAPRNVALMYCIKYSNSTNFASSESSSVAGDVVGTLASTTVVKLRNVPLTSSAPQDGDILLYDSASNMWYGGSPNIGGAPGKSFWVANPGCVIGDNTRNRIFVYNYERHSGRRMLVKIDMDSNVVTHQTQWPTDNWNFNGRIFRKSTDGLLHIMANSDGDIYDYDIDGQVATRLTGSSGAINHLLTPVKISWASGSLRPTIWSLYGGYNAGGNGDVPTFRYYKTYWNGASWTYSVLPSALALDIKSVQNNTEYRKFLAYSTNPGNSSNTLMWDYNYIKKRYYMIDTSTGYMHIFTQDTGDIDTNFNTSSISYSKTIAVSVPSMDSWQDADAEKFIVDYDPDTGEERGICHTRRGNNSLLGVAAYIYWPE